MYVSSSKKRGQAKDCGLSIRLRGVSVIIFDLSDTSLKKLILPPVSLKTQSTQRKAGFKS
jgi:hypothetical protein